MTIGPIPWTAIAAWADRNTVTDPDQFEVLSMVVQRLDAEYLALMQASK